MAKDPAVWPQGVKDFAADRERAGLHPEPTNLPGSTSEDRVNTALSQIADYYQPPEGGES